MSTTEDGAAPQVEVVDPATAPPGDAQQQETVMDPAKLLRIASMVRQLLDDTRQATLDEGGRKRLADIYQRSVAELGESISQDLKEELAELAPPLGGVPSESEIRIAQAQLVGWLEGLFHGIQAAMFAQQAAARQQFEELRRRGLPGGQAGQSDQQDPAAGPQTRGQYL
jgi:hypothetical protein